MSSLVQAFPSYIQMGVCSMKVIIVKGSQLHKNVHDCYDMIVNEYKKAIKRDRSIQKKVQQSLKNKEGG